LSEKTSKKDIRRGQKNIKSHLKGSGSRFKALAEDGKVADKEELKKARVAHRRENIRNINHLASSGKKRK
jgi:hypothetical protein